MPHSTILEALGRVCQLTAGLGNPQKNSSAGPAPEKAVTWGIGSGEWLHRLLEAGQGADELSAEHLAGPDDSLTQLLEGAEKHYKEWPPL
jgi:hypothetical protein